MHEMICQVRIIFCVIPTPLSYVLSYVLIYMNSCAPRWKRYQWRSPKCSLLERNCLGVSGITEKSLVWSYSGSQSPVRSEIPLRPAPTLHLRPWHNVKKKRSPSSWRRSNQQLKSFLEKKSSQERQERGTVVVGESQESPATPINAPPPPPPCWEIAIPWISSVTVW